MATELLGSDATVEDAERVFIDNAPPIRSVEQAERLIRATNILRYRLPSESEGAGSRIAMRDLLNVIEEANRWRSIHDAAGCRNRFPSLMGRD